MSKDLNLDDFKGKRLIKLKTAMQILDIEDYKTLKRTLEVENIPVISFGDSERIDLLDIERAIEQKKNLKAS